MAKLPDGKVIQLKRGGGNYMKDERRSFLLNNVHIFDTVNIIHCGGIMKAKLTSLILAFAGLTGCAEPTPPEHIGLGLDTANYGYFDHGGRWGVNIGQTPMEARLGLAEYGAAWMGPAVCTGQIRQVLSCPEGEAGDYYGQEALPNLRLFFVFYRNGRVSSVYWETFPAAGVDF